INMRKLRKRQNGQGLVEFALILPMLLVLLFGIIDMGWIAFNFSQTYNGVREGVRYGSVSGFTATKQYLDCATIRATIIRLAGFSGISAGNITIIYDDGRDTAVTAAAEVGSCPNGGSFTQNASYIPQGGASASPRNVQNGDRIVITIDVNLRFLTPFL